MIQNESKWSRRLLAELTGESASAFSDVTQKAVHGIIESGIFQGRSWRDVWARLANADFDRIVKACSDGLAAGLTNEQIVRIIMGTKAGNYTDGILSTNRNAARNAVRTLCSAIANEAKDEFYLENDDVVTGVEWLDTLDGRTCVSCASLSRMRWGIHDPHPVPPAHPSCRCVLLPVTILTDLGEDMPRPMANADFDAEAKRMYEAKYPGKDFSKLSYSTRQKYRYKAIEAWEAKTGRKAYSRAPGSMSFRDYFERMSEQQKKDWLKPERYKLWKSGAYKIEDFIPPYPDKMMSVKELKALDKKSFERL